MLRAADGRRCKLVAPAYRRRSDEAWAAGVEHNALAVAPLAVPDSVAEEQAARR